MQPVIALMGPTASGKSNLAMALAREREIEIVSVDSAQVYRDLDVGTAKPSNAERVAVPHHLIDLVPPNESYSAARFRKDALAAIAAIQSRGRLAVLVGGTMLYFKALREGLSALPQADAATRATIDDEAAARGWPALHAELACVDPITAARLGSNDAQRIQRALEVYRMTGSPMSAQLAPAVDAALPFPLIQIGLVPADRAALHARIAERFDVMLTSGLVDEVRRLREHYELAPTMSSMRAVGYRQAWEHLDGVYDRAELRDRGIFATRQLAKRQLTWLRGWPELIAIDPFAGDALDRLRQIIASQ